MSNEPECNKCGTSEHVVDDHRCADHARKHPKIRLNAFYQDGVLTLEINRGDGAFGIVRCLGNGEITLVEVPAFGGDEQESGVYPTVNAAIQAVLAW